jgi:APA family basic amino acid/polyamine antiporter
MNQTSRENSMELGRKLGLFSVTNIIIANMIGAGIFTTSGLLMKQLNHPVLMLILWFAGGIIALSGAFCYGALGAAFPKAGGEYIFLSKLFHPLLGFLSGWVSFVVGFSAPIAASSIGFSEYFIRSFPQIMEFDFINPLMIKKVLSIFIILLFTVIHLRRLEFGTGIQNILTISKVALMGLIICLGFIFGTGNINHIFQGAPLTFNFGQLKTIGLSLIWIMFAYSGWNAATYIGSEIKNPDKNLPFSLIIGATAVMLLYLCFNLIYLYAVPPEDMKGVISIGGLAVGNLFGPSMDKFFSLFISFALLSSISAFIILGPRVYYAMARNGHFFRFAAEVNRKTGIPSRSVILQCIISIIMVVSGTFDQILTYMGFSLGIFPIVAVCGVFKLRKNLKKKYPLPAFPISPVLYLSASILILFFALFERPVESAIAITTVIIGLPLYFIFSKQIERNKSS